MKTSPVCLLARRLRPTRQVRKTSNMLSQHILGTPASSAPAAYFSHAAQLGPIAVFLPNARVSSEQPFSAFADDPDMLLPPLGYGTDGAWRPLGPRHLNQHQHDGLRFPPRSPGAATAAAAQKMAVKAAQAAVRARGKTLISAESVRRFGLFHAFRFLILQGMFLLVLFSLVDAVDEVAPRSFHILRWWGNMNKYLATVCSIGTLARCIAPP